MSSWVLFRGWAREARHWGAFPAVLAAALPGARIVTPDLPGSGTLCTQTSPTDVASMVDRIRNKLDPGEPRFLLGLSLGGMVCVDWACRYPDEVAGCVLINTSLRPFSPFYERLRPRHYLALARLVLVERDTQAREAQILRLTSASTPDAALLDDWTRYAREQPLSRANVLRQLVAAARYRAPRTAPPVPLLALAAERDDLVDPRCSRTLAKRWNAPLALHPSAGHDLPLDDGAWVAARVREWLMPPT